jgi:hypothetical protein
LLADADTGAGVLAGADSGEIAGADVPAEAVKIVLLIASVSIIDKKFLILIVFQLVSII